MATARDVATYILEALGPMTSMKLQKLCYYSQAYSLAWFSEPIFPDEIEAWTNGPVIRTLWNTHKRRFSVDAETIAGDSRTLTQRDRAVVNAVLNAMGGLTGKQLSDQTHAETPWRANYDGDDAYPNGVISHAQLAEYYSKK
ncbi:Panacea domain-containing protein [Microbacterium hydrocarbonoxydans]|uniref:Panacea domain-containing protein n=1 Tax=Microbacterium hydrocarbonoxydans TaxID=273678 RepID=UPI00203F069A|nr:type II toxin-antitoxin system antitoxin SocA domain-containing protein [Microbacterium hydrocarbonoxydans]MCM3778811.1 DUF4065 domain-containing protein [Microbacterium hydrocarbonoxydans]